MIPNRSYQAQIIQDELAWRPKRPRFKRPKKKRFLKVAKDKAKAYLLLFLETSSIHGLNHFVAAGRHYCEGLLWLAIVILSLFGSVYLSGTTWMRYQSSPTVISMDRDMFAWNTSFPCVTICPNKKYDRARLEAFVSNANVTDKDKLEEFLKALAYATFDDFSKVPAYTEIPPEDYMDALINISFIFKPTLTIGASGVSLEVVPTITEMGLCYAINSNVAVYNSPEYRNANRWDMLEARNDTFSVHPLDGEVFAQVVNFSTAYDIYIHGPLEVPDIATKRQHSEENFYMKIYVTAVTVYTSEAAAKLSIGQRRCRFLHENYLKYNSIYTYTMCRMECRIMLCLKLCHCIPHFYRRIGDEKICDAGGLKCLAEKKAELYKLTNSEDKRIDCGCLPNCDDVNYVIQSNAIKPWFLGTTLQWGLVTYPRMRYRREIIFGFTDVLVSVGGMAGLFLGCSVLSFMEIVYFISLRLLCYTRAADK